MPPGPLDLYVYIVVTKYSTEAHWKGDSDPQIRGSKESIRAGDGRGQLQGLGQWLCHRHPTWQTGSKALRMEAGWGCSHQSPCSPGQACLLTQRFCYFLKLYHQQRTEYSNAGTYAGGLTSEHIRGRLHLFGDGRRFMVWHSSCHHEARGKTPKLSSGIHHLAYPPPVPCLR